MRMLEGKKILVVGLGKSGRAASLCLLRKGAVVHAIDSADSEALLEVASELRESGALVALNSQLPPERDYDLVVVSPGVPESAPIYAWAESERIKVLSELELGWKLLRNKTVAVTGTNGKTTTTALIERCLLASGIKAVACGNIGKPVCGLDGTLSGEEVLVIEASSFQLRNIDEFKPYVAVVLNVAHDHYDWHSGFEDYLAAKTRIVENQEEKDFLIYNVDDGGCRRISREALSVKVPFGLSNTSKRGVWIEGGFLCAGFPLCKKTRIIEVSSIRLGGVPGLINSMAAAGAALAAGADPQSVSDAICGFEGLEHRMEFVRKVRGVSFYNDSKATNPHATISAVKSFNVPLVVILGGRNKGLDFDVLSREMLRAWNEGILKSIVLMGESAAEIEKSVRGVFCSGSTPDIYLAKDIEDAVSNSYKKALELRSEEVAVLFSPACASFDMFEDYAHRGIAFKECVKGL